MSSLLLAGVLLFGGFDIGGRVAGVYPAGDLNRFHSSSALLGANVGWSSGPVRFELGYGYTSLPGRQASPYRVSLHHPTLSVGWSFVDRPGWGFEAVAGGGYAFAGRAYGSGREDGGAPASDLAINFVQRSGSSRLTVGFGHTMFIENGAGSGLVFNHLLSVRAGVAYAP